MRKNKRTIKPARTQPVNDGFANFAMGLGVSPNSTNQISQGYFEFTNLTKNRIQLEAGYRSNWLCAALVDCVANDMTRAGVRFTGELDPKRLTDFRTFWQRAGIMDDITDGIRWSRLYGGAIAMIMTKGTDYSKPLDVSRVGKGDFLGMVVYDRWDLTPDLTRLIQNGRDVGLPEYYTINSLGGMIVHHSHVLRFTGDKLPKYQAINEMLWGASVIENVIDRIVAFETVTMGAANLSSRAHLRTIKVDGLRQIFAMGGKAEENLVKQFQYIRQMQNNEGITLIDKLDEFETSAYTFSGLDTLILQFVQQISGAKRIPLPILFGESPAGLNATGDSDIRIYYDGINARQNQLDELMTKLARIVYQSQFGEPAPEDLGVEWNPLWQTTALEKSTIATQTTANVNALFESGLFSRELALKELKQASEATGFGTNITDEDIAADVPPEYQEPTEPQESRADMLKKAKELLGA